MCHSGILSTHLQSLIDAVAASSQSQREMEQLKEEDLDRLPLSLHVRQC